MSGTPTSNHWSDLDRALFWLDGACQSLVDEFHAQVWPEALTLLDKHRDRVTQLRREYALAAGRTGGEGD